MLTIQDTSAFNPGRKRVTVHARTHPNEVQAFWVTDAMINILLGDSPFSRALRQQCVFNILPMYNPDGVELGYPRENANMVDIESNWNKNPMEVEVQALQKLYKSFMDSGMPTQVALNMHSSVSCTRYFVYHHQNGTSGLYTQYEQQFISGVRSYWLEGIEPWDYFVSWGSGTPTQYPESWFWLNYQEQVMALTYEDMNCETAGDYPKTADAILNGVADYLGIDKTPVAIEPLHNNIQPAEFSVIDVFPNPLRESYHSTIRLTLANNSEGDLALYDVLGRKIADIKRGFFKKGVSTFTLPDIQLAGGIYFAVLKTGTGILSTKVLTIYR